MGCPYCGHSTLSRTLGALAWTCDHCHVTVSNMLLKQMSSPPSAVSFFSQMPMLPPSKSARGYGFVPAVEFSDMKEIVAAPIEGWRLWRIIRRDQIETFTDDLVRELADAHDRGENPWRRLLLQPKLAALAQNCRWDRTMTAACVTDAHHPDEPPSRYCGCGVWAFKTEEDMSARLVDYLDEHGLPIAYGRVQLWGRIIEHQHGYRAQHARPFHVTIVGDNDDATARALAAFYGCEVGYGLPPDGALMRAE